MMASDIDRLKKYIENVDSKDLPMVVEMFNDYWIDNSSDICPTRIVEMGAYEPEDPFNEFNVLCKDYNIKPLEVVEYLSYARQSGIDPLIHFDSAFYAVFDRDGIIPGDLYKITFPTNNELKKLIAGFAKEIYEHIDSKIKSGDLCEEDPVTAVFKKMKKSMEKAR